MQQLASEPIYSCLKIKKENKISKLSFFFSRLISFADVFRLIGKVYIARQQRVVVGTKQYSPRNFVLILFFWGGC